MYLIPVVSIPISHIFMLFIAMHARNWRLLFCCFQIKNVYFTVKFSEIKLFMSCGLKIKGKALTADKQQNMWLHMFRIKTFILQDSNTVWLLFIQQIPLWQYNQDQLIQPKSTHATILTSSINSKDLPLSQTVPCSNPNSWPWHLHKDFLKLSLGQFILQSSLPQPSAKQREPWVQL